MLNLTWVSEKHKDPVLGVTMEILQLLDAKRVSYATVMQVDLKHYRWSASGPGVPLQLSKCGAKLTLEQAKQQVQDYLKSKLEKPQGLGSAIKASKNGWLVLGTITRETKDRVYFKATGSTRAQGYHRRDTSIKFFKPGTYDGVSEIEAWVLSKE